MSFVVIVPTLNAGSLWLKWIEAYKAQSQLPDSILIVDSGSVDETVKESKRAGFDIRIIKSADFDHGGTRQKAVNDFNSYDYAVLLTQDAVLSGEESIANLLSYFSDAEVAAVCGRQLPRKSAKPIEAHARIFNYGPESYVRSIGDAKDYGLKTAFISNSFAAYRISALKEVGGFQDNVIFGEDMYVAAKLLIKGYKVAYAADACVCHSHGYSVLQEMKRYFDMGVFHAREPWIRKELGGAEGEGVKFVVSELKYLFGHSFLCIPEGIMRSLLRYTGFRLGLMERKLPLRLKRAFAMNKGYFKQ